MNNLNYKTIRKIAFTLLMLLTLSLNAQDYVVKFLGIPVDGTKSEMISQLKRKGFKWDIENDCLFGRFNGNDVIVFIHTNNEKVWRLAILDEYLSDDEINIRIRFNKLLDQFENNDKYIAQLLSTNEKIEKNEDISYEMSVHNKRYEANFIQMPSDDDIVSLFSDENFFSSWLAKNYTTIELDSIYSTSKDETEFTEKLGNSFYRQYRLNAMFSNSVWFTIYESYGKYGILLFYENKDNEANGEDL